MPRVARATCSCDRKRGEATPSNPAPPMDFNNSRRFMDIPEPSHYFARYLVQEAPPLWVPCRAAVLVQWSTRCHIPLQIYTNTRRSDGTANSLALRLLLRCTAG